MWAIQLLILIVSFVALIKGADIFVVGSSGLAKKLKISSLVIGLTVVAFGTSAPELAVSVAAAINGQADIALSNVVGSNIFNVLGVLGITAIISPLVANKSVIKKEFPFMLLASMALLVMGADAILVGGDNIISTSEGILLLLFFAVFMYSLLIFAKSSNGNAIAPIQKLNCDNAPVCDNATNDTNIVNANGLDEPQQVSSDNPLPNDNATAVATTRPLTTKKSILLALLGLALIVVGGKFVVSSASELAKFIGMSENLIGLTIIAVGTSLPELVTSIVAARKGENDIAIGNVVGSNIFNILFILGVSATITPITLGAFALIDIIIMTVVGLLAFVFAFSRRKVNRVEGIILTALYIAYTVYIIIR